MESQTKVFAAATISRLLDIPQSDVIRALGDEPPAEVAGIPIADLIELALQIYETIERLIEDCPAPELEMLDAAKKPTLLAVARARRVAASVGRSGRRRWRNFSAAIVRAMQATVEASDDATLIGVYRDQLRR